MIGLPESFLKEYNEKHSPHTLFGVISSSISAGADWATALLDWAKRKEITINGAAKTADFTDNFASDNWTNIEGSSVGVSGEVLAYNAYTGGGSSGDGEYRDYGSVLSDTFVWRFKWNATTVVKGGNLANNEVNISISSNNSKNDIVNDAVGFLLRVDSANKQLNAGIWDNTAPASTASTNTTLEASTFSAGTYYCEVVRHSNRKFTFTIYNDVDFSEVVYTTTLTNSADLLDLQYFKVTTDHETSADSANDGSLDDIQFWNGETVVENIPSQQTITYSDDFSGTDDWLDQGSGVGVNTSTDRLEFSSWTDDTTNNSSTLDLGSALSDTDWTIRFKLHWTGFSNTSDWTAPAIGMFSASSATAGNSNQDMLYYWSIANGSTKRVYLSSSDNDSMSGTDHNLNLSWVTGTTYYVQLQRDGASFSATVWTGSYEGTEVASGTDTIGGTVSGLQYFGVKSPVMNRGGSFSGWLDDLQIWDNFSGEINPTTLTDYPLTIKIQGDADLKEKTTETFEELGDWDNQTVADAAWTRNDTVNNFARANSPTADVINYTQDSDGSNDNIVNDLTSVSDTKWRCDLDVKLTQASSYPELWFGLMTGDESVAANSGTQDFIAIKFTSSAAIGLDSTSLHYGDGVILESATNAGTITDPWAVGQTKYLSLIRLSDTKILLQMFADKSRTISKGSVIGTIPSTIASLQYIKMSNRVVSNATSATLEVSNIRFWNGITNPVTQETPTSRSDFTSTPLDSESSAEISYNPATDVVDFHLDGNSVNNSGRGTIDVQTAIGQALSDKWVAEFDINTTAIVDTNTTRMTYFFGFTSQDQDIPTTNILGIVSDLDSSPQRDDLGLTASDSADSDPLTTDVTNLDTNPHYYIRLIRDGNTLNAEYYTDSARTILFASGTLDISSFDNTGLRYFGIWDDWVATGTVNTHTGKWSEFAFWNGITSPNAEGRKIVFTDNAFDGDAVEYASETVSYDPINGDLEAVVKIPTLTTGADTTIQMYYDYAATNPSYVPELFTSMPTADSVFGVNGDQVIEDCTTYTNTTEGDADYVPSVTGTNECRLNPSTNVIDCRFEDASPDHFVTYRDLTGATITDNAWTLRCKVATTVITAPSGGLSHSVFIGMSNNTSNFATAQDFLGISFWNAGASASPNTAKHYAVYRDGVIGGTSTQTPAASSVAFTTAWTNSDTYYIEIIRVSDTKLTVELFSDSAYTTSVEKQTVIVPSTVTALRYFKAGVYDNANVVGFTMTIDDLEFWEGVNKNREESTYDSNYKAVYNLHGNSLDSTANGNDGTDTAVYYEQQNNSLGAVFNGSTSGIDCGSDLSLDDHWAGGGHLTVWMNPKSDGEASAGSVMRRLGSSIGWFFSLHAESGGFVKMRFLQEFTTTYGFWFSDLIIPINELTKFDIYYNSDSVNNDPVFVMNGIKVNVVENTTPVGTAEPAGADPLSIGDSSGSETFDGLIGNIKISNVTRPTSEAITAYNAEKSDSDIITAGDENTQ